MPAQISCNPASFLRPCSWADAWRGPKTQLARTSTAKRRGEDSLHPGFHLPWAIRTVTWKQTELGEHHSMGGRGDVESREAQKE